MVRAGDGASSNLIEAGDGSTDADSLHKMRTALREAKESKGCLRKIRMGPLANAPRVASLGLEQEADELCAIYSSIIINMESAWPVSARRAGRARYDGGKCQSSMRLIGR